MAIGLFLFVGIFWVWFSSVSVIILFSVLAYECINIANHKHWNRLKYISIIGISWSLIYIFYYINFVYLHPAIANMKYYWADYFLPTTSLGDFYNWIKEEFYVLFNRFLWFGTRSSLVISTMVLGFLISIFYKRSMMLLALPVVIGLILSALHIYPFHDRLILFLIPALFGFLAYAISLPIILIRRKWIGVVITLLIMFYLIKYPNRWANGFYKDPPMREHIRPAFDIMDKNMESEDIIYVYYGTYKSFRFYQDYYFNGHEKFIIGVNSEANYDKFLQQFNTLSGRIWIPLAHMTPFNGITYLENWISENPDQVIKSYEFTDNWGYNSKTILIDKQSMR